MVTGHTESLVKGQYNLWRTLDWRPSLTRDVMVLRKRWSPTLDLSLLVIIFCCNSRVNCL
jgi:hypothetical protein